ncbi:spore coat protein [Paenibacillus gansuensis]|uniref:Spore coat protein n=1 Tax=Paenibacillus gansuensis TaxID=306542 RepID=A0ABW5P9F1_9BACL
MSQEYRKPEEHLAWHETLELHELTAFQSNNLTALKMNMPNVKDAQLKALYTEAIKNLEKNLEELLAYYPQAPKPMRAVAEGDLTPFYAGQLLIFAKTAVRNYSIAITETATPQLRETFRKHLNKAIDMHAKVFNFMYQRDLYPAYNLDRLLAADVKNAEKAIKL